MNLFEQFKAFQIILCPSSVLEHGFQKARTKRLSTAMEGYSYSATIGMAVGPMAAPLADENKPILKQGAHELPRRDVSRQDHTFTTTVGAGLTSTSGSVGIGSPAWRRAST